MRRRWSAGTAMSLTDLSLLLADLGWREEALTASAEATPPARACPVVLLIAAGWPGHDGFVRRL
jgi:hypothetical protein